MYIQFTSWVQEDFIMKTQSFEQETVSYHWRRSGIFIDKFKHVSHLFLVFLLLT